MNRNTTKKTKRESRELLLKEYFLNAYLIAMLKQVGEQSRRLRESVAANALLEAEGAAR